MMIIFCARVVIYGDNKIRSAQCPHVPSTESTQKPRFQRDLYANFQISNFFRSLWACFEGLCEYFKFLFWGQLQVRVGGVVVGLLC